MAVCFINEGAYNEREAIPEKKSYLSPLWLQTDARCR